MSLFDELLTKSQASDGSNASGGTGQQQDPLSGSSIVIKEETPIPTTVMDGVVMVPIEPPVTISPEPIKKIPVSNDALIISDTAEEVTSGVSEKTDEIKEPVQATNSLFGMINSSENDSEVSSVSSKKIPEVSFRDTNEYIEHAIDEVSELISSLDAADQAKLAEESEYEHQKEHFAELEVQAETEHQKILAEKAHAEEMKKYLESERATTENISDEVTQQDEESLSSEQESLGDVSQDEDQPEEDVSPKKKEWNGFSKKNKKDEEESREVFI